MPSTLFLANSLAVLAHFIEEQDDLMSTYNINVSTHKQTIRNKLENCLKWKLNGFGFLKSLKFMKNILVSKSFVEPSQSVRKRHRVALQRETRLPSWYHVYFKCQ